MSKDSFSASYAASGVDIEAGYRAVELMKQHITRTLRPEVMSPIGGFGGLFAPNLAGMSRPVLVSGTDGVGTKLKLAFLLDKHNSVGIDCVAMCANDVVCAGAAPLFFLDYVAVGKNIPELVADIVSGVAEGCVQAGAALIGGETAEMPGLYQPGEYDLAGFCVGVADADKLLRPETVQPGDAIIALPSSGIHSNGFSLVRRVFDVEHADLGAVPAGLTAPLGETLLTPTRIYVKPLLSLMEQVQVHALAHITGGGFYENIPRALPEGCRAVVEQKSLRIPPIFGLIQQQGSIPERDMFNTFNMGVGMVAIVAEAQREAALDCLAAAGEEAYVIGHIASGERGVELC